MNQSLQITFRDIDHSDAIEAAVRKKAEKLEQFCDDILACRVMIEAPHAHQHQGRLYHVRIDMSVPGAELVANRAPSAHQAHENLYVSIRDAFDAAKRQLQSYKRRLEGRKLSKKRAIRDEDFIDLEPEMNEQEYLPLLKIQ